MLACQNAAAIASSLMTKPKRKQELPVNLQAAEKYLVAFHKAGCVYVSGYDKGRPIFAWNNKPFEKPDQPLNGVPFTLKMMNRDQREKRFFTYKGKTLGVREIAKLEGVHAASISSRLFRGDTIEEAVEHLKALNKKRAEEAAARTVTVDQLKHVPNSVFALGVLA